MQEVILLLQLLHLPLHSGYFPVSAGQDCTLMLWQLTLEPEVTPCKISCLT